MILILLRFLEAYSGIRLAAIPQETLITPGSLREGDIDPLETTNVDDINPAFQKVGLAPLIAD